MRSSSLSRVATACVCVCIDSRLPICVGIRPEWAGWIHAGRLLNRCTICGAGRTSGSVRVGFEGAEHPVGVSIVLPSAGPSTTTTTTTAAAASVEVRVRTPWLPNISSTDAEQRTVPQDGLQLLHGLPGDAHLTVGPPGLWRHLFGPVLPNGRFIHPGIISSFGGPVRQRADGDHSRGVWR